MQMVIPRHLSRIRRGAVQIVVRAVIGKLAPVARATEGARNSHL
jgi:hypothetical protein